MSYYVRPATPTSSSNNRGSNNNSNATQRGTNNHNNNNTMLNISTTTSRTATSVNLLESSFNNNGNSHQQQQDQTATNIHYASSLSAAAESLNKPVLVVARVRDFAPFEDPSKRSVFVTGERTCFVQLPHQRGKVDFLVDAVIGGTGEDDIDPRTGQQVYHPQIHYDTTNVVINTNTNNNKNGSSSSLTQQQELASSYEYYSKHPNVISSPFSPAVRGRGSQQAVYDKIGAPLVDCLVQGRNATVVAYGSTFSGKSFTCFGPKESLGTPLEGLIPRMVQGVFEACNSAQGFFHTNISVTILEVFLEDVYDLLDPGRPKLKLRGDTNRGFVPVGETTVRVTSYEQVRILLADAERRRMTLDMNEHHRSSRSHVLFFLSLQRFMARGVEISSKLLVADLAGSERTHHKNDPMNSRLSHFQQHEHDMKFESAISINMSLLALGSVIEAAARSEGNVFNNNNNNNNNTNISINNSLLPEFRRSTLTKLMKDHIGGNSRTVVIVTCSPTAESANNSIRALRFGQRAMKVRTNSRINVAIRGTSNYNLTGTGGNRNVSTFYNNNNSMKNENDRVAELLRLRLAKRRAMVDVECALEEELLQIRRKIQKLETDLSQSPIPQGYEDDHHNHQGNSSFPNYSSSSISSSAAAHNKSQASIRAHLQKQQQQQQNRIITSDIIEKRAKELQEAIAEEARIERDLFTLFDCPSSVVSNVVEKYSKRSSSGRPDYRKAMEELNSFMVASASQQEYLLQQQSISIDDDDIEAEESTMFAVVRKRHESEMNDVRAQAWRTSTTNNNNNNNHNIITSLSPRSPSMPPAAIMTKQDASTAFSPIRNVITSSVSASASVATSPIQNLQFNNSSPPRNNISHDSNSSFLITSPSREQLEKLLSDANEEIEHLRNRLEDRERKCAELAQKLIIGDRLRHMQNDLTFTEHEESLSRSSLEMSQVRFLSELRASYLQDRTRLEYFGHLRKTLDDRERAFGGERERQLRRELEESRRETRNAREEAEGLQIKLEIANTERTQLSKESDSRWQRVADLETQVEILKTENEQLKNHGEILKTHYEHQVTLQDLQRERLKNDTQLSLTKMKFDGQRTVEENARQQQSQNGNPGFGKNGVGERNIDTSFSSSAAVALPKHNDGTRQPSEVSDIVYHRGDDDNNDDQFSHRSAISSQTNFSSQQQQRLPSQHSDNNNFNYTLEEKIRNVERVLDRVNANNNNNINNSKNIIEDDELLRAAVEATRSARTNHMHQDRQQNLQYYHETASQQSDLVSPSIPLSLVSLQQQQQNIQHPAPQSQSNSNNNNNPLPRSPAQSSENINNNKNDALQIRKEDRSRMDLLDDIRFNQRQQQQQLRGTTIPLMTETLSTSQLSAVNRYYATILAERERVNHLIDTNVAADDDYRHQQGRYSPTRFQTDSRRNSPEYHNDSDSLHDHRRVQPKASTTMSPSETEYRVARTGDDHSQENYVFSEDAANAALIATQQQQQERLKLLEQQLILERLRSEQKQLFTAGDKDSAKVGARPVTSRGNSQSNQHYLEKQQQQQHTAPRYISETASSQNRHNYSLAIQQQGQLPPSEKDQHLLQQQSRDSRRTSPTAPSWSSKAAMNLVNNISRHSDAAHFNNMMSHTASSNSGRPANVAYENLVGSPRNYY